MAFMRPDDQARRAIDRVDRPWKQSERQKNRKDRIHGRQAVRNVWYNPYVRVWWRIGAMREAGLLTPAFVRSTYSRRWYICDCQRRVAHAAILTRPRTLRDRHGLGMLRGK